MITRYEIALRPDRPCCPRPEWGYRLYAALLDEAADSFGADVHRDTVTPLSQFLLIQGKDLTWIVNLLGGKSEQNLSPLLERQSSFRLQKDRVELTATCRRKEQLTDADELLARGREAKGRHLLQFQTPAAFKSQGHYRNLPTERLIVQNLMNKWNGCFPECPIEDEDGQGMEALAAGLSFRRFHLQNGTFDLKGKPIPGFTGELLVENRLSGFHRELADMLLVFSQYSGIGIKTALGMGGVRRAPCPREAD